MGCGWGRVIPSFDPDPSRFNKTSQGGVGLFLIESRGYGLVLIHILHVSTSHHMGVRGPIVDREQRLWVGFDPYPSRFYKPSHGGVGLL